MSMWSRLVNVFRGDRLIREIDEELESHLAESAAAGRDPAEARRAFGGFVQRREESRDLRQVRWLADLVADLRYGVRTLRRQPTFFLTAVLSLALGIGANGALFSIADAVLLRTLPVRQPEQLVTVRDSATGGNFSYPDYVALRAGAHTFSDLGAASFMARLPVAVSGEIDQVSVTQVSGNYFAALGVNPALGRLFAGSDELAPVAIVSHNYWRRRFEAAESVLGQAITIDSVPVNIVGVAPAGFTGETPGDEPDVWTSFALRPPEMRDERGYSWLYLLGRLRPGATVNQAQADLAALFTTNRTTTPRSEPASHLTVASGARGLPALRDRFADPLYVLIALATTVLLLASTNLAGLLATRGAARQSEIALRMAIGASGERIIRQLITESLLLAAAAGALGLMLAIWGSAALLQLPLGERPIALEVGPSLRLVAFTGIISIAAGLLFGVAPSWRTVRRSQVIRGAARVIGRNGVGALRGVFVTAQVALSIVLLAGSVVFVRTLRNLETQDVGFHADHVLLVPITAERGHRPALSTFIPDLLARIRTVPGVSSATVAVGGTLNSIGGVRVQVEGGVTPDRVNADWVGPDYLRTAGMTVLAGRDFSAADDERGQNAVIVNETLARRYFGDGRAIGRHVLFNKATYSIIGVVKDAKYRSLRETTAPFIYFSTMQTHSGVGHVEIRTAGIARPSLIGAIRPIVRELDPHLSASTPTTLSDQIDRKLGREHLVADLAGFFGMLTLIVLSIGVYGTLAYSVGQRTKEIGVRLALGASGSNIAWMVFRQIGSVIVVGVTIGIGAVMAIGGLVKPLLFGVAPTDPQTMAAAIAVLVGVSILAGSVPTQTALSIDAATVLRE